MPIGHVGGMLGHNNIPMVGIQDMDEHLRRRRAWNRGLSQNALKEYEQIIATRAQQLLHRLEEQQGEVILGNWFKYFSFVFTLFVHSKIWRGTDIFTLATALISCVTWRTLVLRRSCMQCLTYICSSFGGGSELLRYGDTNNVWRILEEGMVSVQRLYPLVSLRLTTESAQICDVLCESAVAWSLRWASTRRSSLSSESSWE